MIHNVRKRRFVQSDPDKFEEQSRKVVGLSLQNPNCEMMSKELDLVSKYLTTRYGMSYEATSKTVFQQQPLIGDLSAPYTLVSHQNIQVLCIIRNFFVL